MVTTKALHVVASYQDILDDPLVEPSIFHMFDEYYLFESDLSRTKLGRKSSREESTYIFSILTVYLLENKY